MEGLWLGISVGGCHLSSVSLTDTTLAQSDLHRQEFELGVRENPELEA
jgi:hypothetical protein